ncbi:hypothetical protein SAMN04488564_112108 [Lentzea waywayandensis]|uniref:Uncharacterized protein n=1 Tax=Lentzea waywayandensis TaxID=84724 RepID=A0A1I6FE11_9PSEU|nr:hypothetical protein [Lentzea waywayandensis]SFR27997.1 hypothetical protein SAMN04488564_112108 [Lentzea waywayandensis]
MAAPQTGFVRTYAHKKVVILKTGLSIGDEDAVLIAPLISAKPPAATPGVEVKTAYGRYWVLTGQANTVRTADLVTVWWGPERLRPDQMKIVQQEHGKNSK